jgi:hypothetical protein
MMQAVGMLSGDFLCILEHWLQLFSAIFAALAAVTWFWASRIKAVITPDQMKPLYDVPIPALERLVGLVSKQSRLNAAAAFFAAIAALCQIPQAFMPTCWS